MSNPEAVRFTFPDQDTRNLEKNKCLECIKLQEEINRLKEEIILDSRTKLFNKKHFYDTLKEKDSKIQSSEKIITEGDYVMMLDIDDFKKFNSTYSQFILSPRFRTVT